MDWKEQLYLTPENEDPHYLTFSVFQKELHGPAREQLKKGAVTAEKSNDVGGAGGADRNSYVATGSLTIFSEDIIKDNQNGPKSMPK